MYDVIVIGAGPAGANAALTAEHYGLNVLLIDEGSDAGGQVWRVKSKSILSAPVTETSLKGDKLRQRVKSSEVDILFETRVWQIEQNEEHVWQLGLQGVCERSSVSGKALIIATGAQERVIPLNGWTLPGVYGLAGATALFKEHMILPGKNTVVAGSGPLVFFVASEIIRLGGTLSAVVTLNSRFEWLKAAAEMISKPGLLWQGVKWVFKLHIKGIPLHWQSALSSINGNEYVQDVDIIKTTKYGYLKRKY